MYLNKILLTTDFSDQSRAAFGLARHEAQISKSDLVLMNVSEAPIVPYGLDGLISNPLFSKDIEAELHKLSTAKLEEYKENFFPNISVRTAAIQSGRSAPIEICEFARINHCGLIVMSRQGKSALGRLLLGSTTEKIIRMAPCPVLITPGDKDNAPVGPYRKILVTTDLSPDSELAFKFAAFEAKLNSADVTLGYIIPELLPPALIGGSGYLANFGIDTAISSYKEAITAKLNSFASEHFPASKVETALIEKWPSSGDSIAAYANSNKIDLVVLATHGHGPAIKLLSGVAERVVRESNSPVLVVPSPGK